MAKLRMFLAILLASCSLLTIMPRAFAVTPCTGTEATNPLCTACKTAPDSPTCKKAKSTGTNDPIAGSDGIINKAANFIAIVAALGAVINIIIGAFEFVTAGGTGFKSATANPAPTKAAKARSRVVSGVIGLAIVALAWVIVRIVTDRVLK